MDFYLNDYEVAKRLLLNWLEHKSIIIAFDFDNTIYDYYNKGYTYNNVITLLKECKELGAILILSTCRFESSYKFMTDVLVSLGINVDYINESPPHIPYHSNKVYYNILLDDRAGLSSAYNVLNKVKQVIALQPVNNEIAINILKNIKENKNE
jgi:hydroxymethylpyrimidine pyrophosphatase-like HAD family hydrolase